MKNFLKKSKIGIAIILVFVFILIAKAGTSYSVDIKSIDTSEFPQVQLELGISGGAENLTARHFSIEENGIKNKGPLILLPSKSFNPKIDLFILLDKSGNTKNDELLIKNNIQALTHYMEENEVDLRVYLQSFNSSDNPVDQEPDTFDEGNLFNENVNQLTFDSGRLGKAYGFNKLYHFTTLNSRSGAEKIVLIINGSQFYDQDRGDDTTYNLRETINQLAAADFLTFVMGYPLKQFHALRSNNTEDGSLSHALPGGYLGGFGVDLTVLYDLLKKRDSSTFVLQYHSDLEPSTAGGATEELFIEDGAVSSFGLSAVSSAPPQIRHIPTGEVLLGESAPVKVEVDTMGKMVNAVLLYYFNKAGDFKPLPLIHERQEKTDTTLSYSGTIPADEYPEDYVSYFAVAYGPYHIVDTIAEMVSVPVLAYDQGIELNSVVVNDEEILWTWSGPTVDMGERYELWAGDQMLISTEERSYSIPITDCGLYQVVKVRVLVKEGADHPQAGGWSLFSRPGERYVGEEGNVTEEEGISKMIECLSQASASSPETFIASEPDYEAESDLDLLKNLYYLTAILDRSLQEGVRYGRYPLIYYLMQFIDAEEYDQYKINVDIPRSMLYKVITQSNQSNDVKALFKDSVEELIRRINGSMTF